MAADVIAPDFVEIDEEAYYCSPAQLSDIDDFIDYIRGVRRSIELEPDDPHGWKRAATIGEVDLAVTLGGFMRDADYDPIYVERLAILLARTWRSSLRYQFPDRHYTVTSEEFDSESITGPFVRYELTK